MKTIVLVLNISLIIALIPSIMLAITSPMIFAAKQTTRLWWTAGTAVALPIVIIICQVITWKAYYRMDYDFALKICLIPIFNGLLLLYFMFTMD